MIDGTFHHVGVATRDLDREAAAFAPLGYVAEGPDFEDPIQGIRGRFLVGPGPRMELVAPAAPGGVLAPWLARGAKLYHVAYEVAGVRARVAALEAAGGRVVAGPVPAVAFGGREIAFVMLPTLLLVELVEREGT
jgi:methylmalonyl-CoA/ethylmalonyl-CoA epimerase